MSVRTVPTETLTRIGDGRQNETLSSLSVADDDRGVTASKKTERFTAINRTIEAVADGRDRILLVMATGTGKTFTAFQMIWRLWKSRQARRILFLADRNILVDQTRSNDFQPFGSAMTKITNRQVEKSNEIDLALYQAVSGTEDREEHLPAVLSRFLQ